MGLAEQLGAIGVVLGLALLLSWLRRQPGKGLRFGRSGLNEARPNLECIQQIRLTPQHSIHVVRIWDRALIVGVHANGCVLLESRQYESETKSTAGPTK